ncbi:MAG: aldehyde-activating protein [Rhodobacterales bacterium]|nr:MAG: aldehyde-activating protein [Rhodobacterales bacterium]
MQTTGRCLCGDLVVAASGAPLRVGICHCDDCRRHHGAMFFAAAVFSATAVTIKGEPSCFEGRCFCPRCGSSVFARSGDEVELHLGALDDASQLTPDYELWTLRRATWLPPFPGMRCYRKEKL